MSQPRRNERSHGMHMRGPGGPGGPHGMAFDKAKDFKGSVKRLLGYLGRYKVKISIVLLLTILSTVFSVVGPRVMQLAYDELELVVKGIKVLDVTYLGYVLLALLLLYAISAGFQLIMSFTMARLTSDMSFSLRQDIINKINRLPIAYFNKTSHGDVLSRITNDVDTMSNSINQVITQVFSSLITVIGVLIMMFSISWQMTLITLCIVPVSLVLVSLIAMRSQKYFKGQQEYLGAVNGHVEEMYGGHLVMKAFGGEEKSIKAFDERNDKLKNSARKADFLSGLMFPVMSLIGNLGYVAVCVAGAGMAAAGNMTVGGIQAFIQYVRSFTQPITQVANISNQIQMLAAASERVFTFMNEAEELNPAPSITTAKAQIRGDVMFDHVRFGYEDSDQIVIKDFSADVSAGQKVAIVGPTGAGKTTLVKLLMRFHELNAGAIYIDGYDIKAFNRHDLRNEIGMVLQDAWLYSGSIMENIRYGRSEATDAEVIKAAKAAQVDHFIRTLPDGYNTEINEEATNISQGQKQLLTIARAILSDARILILDEATSSVDTRTEIQIQRAMDNLMRGRTSFIIAHRLSTIRNADLILYLNEGDIVEQGSHEELIALNGFYAKLYNSQFEKAA